MQFKFSEAKQGECILIPGNVVVMEGMEKTGGLSKYMNDNLNWIRSTFTGEDGFVYRIRALFSSLLTIPQR